MSVTVVIPNYNGREYLHECLDSLRVQSYKEFKVLVVDNGSTDGSQKVIREIYPEVELIENKENYGFSVAVNQGIQAADTEFVILLNNDTMCEYDFVESLVKGIQKSPKIFSCGARMIQYHDRKKLDNTGDFYTILGWAYQRGLDESVKKYKKAGRIFSACAGAAIYRRAVFDEIGLFDPNHFAYLEDVDIGFRANIYGYRNYYIPKAVVYHIGSASSGERYNPFKIRLAARNTVYLYYKNLPNPLLCLHAPFLLLGHVIKYCFFKIKGYEQVYFDGVMEGLKTLDKLEKVPYDSKHKENYVWIEKSMLKSTWNRIKGSLFQ